MSQVDGGDNRRIRAPSRIGGIRRLLVVAVAAAAWTVTMAQVLRSEVLRTRDSRDIRALVDSARLTREHASARYVIRGGEAILGTFSSAVSGSRDEEQLAYVVEGELHAPLQARLKAVLVATWDRKPERLVADLDLGGARHRVDGALAEDGRGFRLRYLAPGTAPEDAVTWELDEVPQLGPGPLPLPAFSTSSLSQSRSGVSESPSGDLAWTLLEARQESLPIGGRMRRATRHELRVRDVDVIAWIDETGLPLRLQLPGGLVAELAEDQR